MKKKVAFQGNQGAYSEVALYQYFGEEKVDAIGFPFSEQVFEAVENGEVDVGFVPVENSIVGNVDINTDLFFRHENVFAISESYLEINHCLLAPKGADINALEVVYSHPIALGQCREFLKQHEIKAVPEYDTAGSAKLVAQKNDLSMGAIASHLCAKYYNLDCLAKNIQTVKSNHTRFLSFIKKDQLPDNLLMQKTSIAFIAGHRPGSLVRCLQTFSRHQINLTKIESRPIPENPFEYIFYADFIGGASDLAVKRCLDEMQADTHQIKVLGSYNRAQYTPK